jgi:hypothetical protein
MISVILFLKLLFYSVILSICFYNYVSLFVFSVMIVFSLKYIFSFVYYESFFLASYFFKLVISFCKTLLLADICWFSRFIFLNLDSRSMLLLCLLISFKSISFFKLLIVLFAVSRAIL